MYRGKRSYLGSTLLPFYNILEYPFENYGVDFTADKDLGYLHMGPDECSKFSAARKFVRFRDNLIALALKGKLH